MAREMALAGVDRSELTPPPPPEQPKTFSDKCKNFWYHYRVHTLIAVFLLIVGGVMLVQSLTKDTADYHVVVVTELPLYNEEVDGMERYLAQCGEDIDGDGKVEVAVENLTPRFYDELAPQVGHADMQKIMSYLSTGERMLFVFDRVSYDGFIGTVSDVTDENYRFFAPLDTASGSYDAASYYWDWCDDATRFEYGLDKLPEHMLFGVRAAVGMADRSASRTLYEQGKALLENVAK